VDDDDDEVLGESDAEVEDDGLSDADVVAWPSGEPRSAVGLARRCRCVTTATTASRLTMRQVMTGSHLLLRALWRVTLNLSGGGTGACC
jgi:hypothetical protein